MVKVKKDNLDSFFTDVMIMVIYKMVYKEIKKERKKFQLFKPYTSLVTNDRCHATVDA